MACDIDVGQTLESGQCFRFWKLSGGLYRVAAGNRVVDVRQTAAGAEFSEPDAFWDGYFDLSTDYASIKSVLVDGDPVMERAVAFAPGIRLLRQDPWETLISFIVSQNNRIPQIMRVIENMCRNYGGAAIGRGDFRAFPTRERLAAAGVEGLMGCRAGFRARYIYGAANMPLDFAALSAMPTGELRKALLSVKGVGDKVADCVLLFGFARREHFPVDVWIGRVMRALYFGGAEVPFGEIHAFAREKWGPLAGYAQQYLFHYARLNKIM